MSIFDRKIVANKSKPLLVENELEKLKIFDSSYFIGKSHFEEDGTQNYSYFSQCTDISNEWLVLVIAVTFITGSLKDCLTETLILLKCLIRVLLQT